MFDHACNVVPDENLKMKCMDMVKTETDTVFDFLQEVVDPDIICHGLMASCFIFWHKKQNGYQSRSVRLKRITKSGRCWKCSTVKLSVILALGVYTKCANFAQ